MKRLLQIAALVFVLSSLAHTQRADLTGIRICIDPGHGGQNPANDRHLIPDPGTDFWESESNFQKALHLKALPEAKGAYVILTRNTNNYPTDAEPSLAARVALANANNVNWFHSIHSNATGLAVNTSTNYTLMLVREKVVDGGDPVYGPGTGQPETQGAWDISLIMGPGIKTRLRTKSSTQYLDWTFYGGKNGGYTLGVLRGLLMPGELSEGSMHDYFPETRRLMNNSYRKMEAYALRDAFLQYFKVPSDSLGIVAGVISELGTGKLIDGVQVRLLPENIVYTGDLYHNGFYMFDGVKAGPHWVKFETPGYRKDSAQVTTGVGETRFLDWQTESYAAPVVLTSTPINNDTSFAASGQIQLTFSKVMDTASVRSNFSTTPFIRGNLLWTASNTVLMFKPDSVVLPFNTSFTLRIEGTAKSQSGLFLDGNGDGTSGDAFELRFKTKPVDVWPPIILMSSPANASTMVAPNSVINFTLDEPLDQSSINTTNIVVREVGTGNRSLSFSYDTKNGRSGINVFPQGGLVSGKLYQMRVSAVKDLVGNPVPNTAPIYTFTVSPDVFQPTVIEDFSSSVASWYQPTTSGSTTGLDSANFARDTVVALSTLPTASRSGRLTYYWNTKTATDWLLREYLSGGPGRSFIWDKQGTRLQTYLYGDGSGMLFRFAVDDSVDVFPGGTTQNHEASPWIPIDWVGWRLVEWNFDTDSVGTWLGNGKLEGKLRFDSFQLKYVQGSKVTSGAIYFAQLQVSKVLATDVEQLAGAVPYAFELQQNYPNPFNPSTTIAYSVDKDEFVELVIVDILGRHVRTLVGARQAAGSYRAIWDGRNDRGETVSSGVYLYQLRAGTSAITRKMVLLK